MPGDLRVQIAETLQHFEDEVDRGLSDWQAARDPVAFRQMELSVAGLCRGLADALVEHVLRSTVSDPAFQVETSAAARAEHRRRHGGRREVAVRLLGGTQVRVRTEYLKPDRRGLVGRPRRKRGKGGAGVYPALAALGIAFGVTPALAGEVCRQVADSDSLRAGRAALARRDLDLGHKQTLRIVNHFGRRAVAQREQFLEQAREQPPAKGPLAGKRVVVSTDGGRIRERRPQRKGRRRTSGHRGYDAPWREPKLFTIYVLDDDGKVEQSFAPVIDGTLGDADATFEMLVAYLRALGAQEASQLVVVGDGAHWIWNRVAAMVEALGIAPERVLEIIDFYHAAATLHAIAAVPARWSAKKRARWVTRARRHLRRGDIDAVLRMIDALRVGRRAKQVGKHRGYFADNRMRMQYPSFEAAKVPLGSGAIESAIRRVINMRMKGNGSFWEEPNAEAMLLLRSYLKAGRFDPLVDWSIATAAPWWRPAAIPDLLASPITST